MANNTVDFNVIDSVNDYLIIQDHDSAEILIMAWDFTLDPATLPTDRNLMILSYKLSISNDLSLDGKNLFLLANHLKLVNSPSITTASHGRPFSGAPKLNNKPCSAERLKAIAPSGDNFNDALNIFEDSQAGGTMNAGRSGNIGLNVIKVNGDVMLSTKGGEGEKDRMVLTEGTAVTFLKKSCNMDRASASIRRRAAAAEQRGGGQATQAILHWYSLNLMSSTVCL